MAPTCTHTNCPEPAYGAGRRSCEEDGIELAIVLALVDATTHIPGQSPE